MPWSRIEQIHSAPDEGRILSYKDAVHEAIDQAMVRDPRVFVIGLDADDKFGAFGTLLNMTHPERVIGTPISENAMTGVALGAALSGMRPLYVHLRVDFMLLTMDQIVNYIAKWRYMTQGQMKVPLVIRAVIGRGWGCGAQHSQSLGSIFAHIPGLKVVMPSTPHDAKGLLLASIKDDYPVIYIEHRWLYKNTGGVPQDMYVIPFGEGRLMHQGKKLTVVASSMAAIDTLNACQKYSLDVDLIDPRTIKPLDETIILNSVAKTGKLLVVDYDSPFCGFGSEICSMVAEKGFTSLKAPVQKITFPECSMPASQILERTFYPNSETIAARIKSMIG